MEMQDNQAPRRANPRRRQRSKLQIFKEAYLPTIILALTLVFIITFIIGGTARSNQASTQPSDTSTSTAATSDPNQAVLLAQEAKQLLADAAVLAADYNYTGAMELLTTFSGNIAEFADLTSAYNQYKAADEAMVSWTADQVPSLAFHMLIADPQRAFNDKELGSSYKKNFITINEFSAILEQLYANGYVLVDLDDLYSAEYDASSGREIFKENVLRLPAGKKPVMLAEVNMGYYAYMIDTNGDLHPDGNADGFAANLDVDSATGKFVNTYALPDGTIDKGAYDMVPILEAFIEAHPDFSFRGARAILGLTGSDGILGWRVHASQLAASARETEKAMAQQVVRHLKTAGYRLACYTYDNINYGTQSATQIQSDLLKWQENVMDVLGSDAGVIDTLIFARDGDIGDTNVYSGSKFTLLYNQGFRYFMGVSADPWNQVNDLYIRHNRLMITGENLLKNADMFAGLFDAATVLDPDRPVS